jgi:hypothetical protein
MGVVEEDIALKSLREERTKLEEEGKKATSWISNIHAIIAGALIRLEAREKDIADKLKALESVEWILKLAKLSDRKLWGKIRTTNVQTEKHGLLSFQECEALISEEIHGRIRKKEKVNISHVNDRVLSHIAGVGVDIVGEVLGKCTPISKEDENIINFAWSKIGEKDVA